MRFLPQLNADRIALALVAAVALLALLIAAKARADLAAVIGAAALSSKGLS